MSKDREKRSIRKGWFGPIFAALIGLALLTAACSADTQPTTAVSGEASGEHGSGGEGSEGGNGESAEGGDTVVLLAADETYDRVVNGARLVLAYDSNANAFVGIVENTTSGTLTDVRVEVHLSNGTELGPTTRTDLAAGESIDINLASTDASFDRWSAHAEIGNAEGGHGPEGGSEGSEAGSEGVEAGSEGDSGESSATATPATYLSSSGFSRGVFTTQELQADEAYAGKLNGLEFALTYDPATGSFPGRVKNEAAEGICDVSIRLIFDGDRANSQSVLIPSLDISERANFNLSADTAVFTTWTVETNTFTCNDVPVHGGSGVGGETGGGESGAEGGSEGAGHEGGSEGGSESGGEGSGHEGGSEGSGEGGGDEGEGATTAIDQPTVTTINGLDVNFAYDPATQAFRGTIENNGNEPLCGVRMEIHVGRGSQTIELGPTVDRNFAPGDSQEMVLAFDALPTDTYGLHPEVTPCP